MNLVGEKVVHKIFGEGTVTKVEGNKISIQFSIEEKIFSFPKEFEERLTVVNRDIAKEISALLEKQKVEEEKEKLKQEQEKKEKEFQKDLTTPKTIYAKYSIKVGERLVCDTNKSYGTDSRKIYEACCKQFGWKVNLANQFGQQGCDMFAWEATREGYHVQFFCNNNWSGTKTSSWENIISGDLQNIYEIWKDELPAGHEESYRVVFAKTSNGQYVFLGVYQLGDLKVEQQEKLIGINRIFKKISHVYPLIEEA